MHRDRLLTARLATVAVMVISLVGSSLGFAHAQRSAGGGAGRTYTLAMSMILSGELAPSIGSQQLQGAQLAVQQQDQALSRSLGISVRLRALDYGVNGAYTPAKAAKNAGIFVADPTVFAEDGPYNSGAAALSMPVYNRAGMAQVSPGNTLPDLTEPRFRAKYEPATAAGKIGITYFRVCTTDAEQGPAGADFAKQRLHVRTGYVVSDWGLPGIGLANAYQRFLPTIGIKMLGRSSLKSSQPGATMRAAVARIKALKPDAVFFGGESDTGGSAFADLLRSQGAHMPIIGGDALLSSAWVVGSNGAYHPGSQNSWFTAIGPNPVKDPRAAAFTAAFRTMFHRDPNGFAALSYDAANIEIDALAQALRAGQGRQGIVALRKAVRARVASTHHHGVGGFTTFNGNGDTTNRVISMWRVNGKTGSSFQWLGYVPGFTPR
jgi:branched-chain amino acid transport system substrate-binding protein